VKKLVLFAAVATALVLPATALASSKTYSGKLKGGGKLTDIIKVQGGDPAEVLKTKFKNVPADCSVNGASLLTGTITWSNFLITNGKFAAHDVVLGDGSTVTHTGTFSHHNKNLNGKFQTTAQHVPPNDETCTTDTQKYSAKLGNGKLAHVGKAMTIARVH
jgi:hypothetical protein